MITCQTRKLCFNFNIHVFTGGRLGHMQSMAGLAAVLAKFTVTPAENTPRVLESDPKASIVQNIIGGIPLMFHARTPVCTDVEDSRSL